MSSTDSSDSNSSKGSINSTGERANEVDSLGNDPEMQQDSEPRVETRNKKSQKRSLEEEEEEKELSFKRTRFEATGEDAHSNWKLPDEMLKYARKQFNFYIKEKDLKDSVLLENPVPKNFKQELKLDPYYNELLEDKRRKRELSLDTMLEKQQSKVQQIMGPLAKIWFRVEEAIADPSSQLDIQELIGYVEQSVLLTGQAYNAISYNRRLNVLTAAGIEKSRAKSSLKNQSKHLFL